VFIKPSVVSYISEEIGSVLLLVTLIHIDVASIYTDLENILLIKLLFELPEFLLIVCSVPLLLNFIFVIEHVLK